MKRTPRLRLLRLVLPLAATLLLSGCHWAVLDPAGPIGVAEKWIIDTAIGLMLLVVGPVIVLTLMIVWRYRASNTKARYEPDWCHSTKIELTMWGIPIVIVCILGVIAWRGSHQLNPFRPILSNVKPVHIEAVAMDWKWLFIYPNHNVASVNEVAMPVGVPVVFHITSATVMNSFFIPRLGSQIYAMANMQTADNLVASAPGTYRGISANFSGGGFSGMVFKVKAMPESDYKRWLAKAGSSTRTLDDKEYLALDKPSSDVPVTYYAHVDPDLFAQILNGKLAPGGPLAMQATTITSGGETGPVGRD
ncbi:MAG: ubiquinol oxidase subunit II [Steroidobacteraceae bacterium]|jgi:cytochrome o ubiquinol oxidase subunit 2